MTTEMGRELKRVPADFAWPVGVPWEGYVCPHEPSRCPDCRGSGVCPEDQSRIYAYIDRVQRDGESLKFHEAYTYLKERSRAYFGCERCRDTGKLWDSEEAHEQFRAWTETDPPTGPGFQLWMCRTGNWPLSPVFLTLGELALWCESNATTFAHFRASASEWADMLTKDRVHAFDGQVHHF